MSTTPKRPVLVAKDGETERRLCLCCVSNGAQYLDYRFLLSREYRSLHRPRPPPFAVPVLHLFPPLRFVASTFSLPLFVFRHARLSVDIRLPFLPLPLFPRGRESDTAGSWSRQEQQADAECLQRKGGNATNSEQTTHAKERKQSIAREQATRQRTAKEETPAVFRGTLTALAERDTDLGASQLRLFPLARGNGEARDSVVVACIPAVASFGAPDVAVKKICRGVC